MKTYIIIFSNGVSIKIEATEVVWCESNRTLRFLNKKEVIARLNFDNIIGWFDESNVKEDADYISYK